MAFGIWHLACVHLCICAFVHLCICVFVHLCVCAFGIGAFGIRLLGIRLFSCYTPSGTYRMYIDCSRDIHEVVTNFVFCFVFSLRQSTSCYWDSGAVHGPTIHKLESEANATYALYYMGTRNTWGRNGTHPNCTVKYDPEMVRHRN